jgi:hypothetical protein
LVVVVSLFPALAIVYPVIPVALNNWKKDLLHAGPGKATVRQLEMPNIK